MYFSNILLSIYWSLGTLEKCIRIILKNWRHLNDVFPSKTSAITSQLATLLILTLLLAAAYSECREQLLWAVCSGVWDLPRNRWTDIIFTRLRVEWMSRVNFSEYSLIHNQWRSNSALPYDNKTWLTSSTKHYYRYQYRSCMHTCSNGVVQSRQFEIIIQPDALVCWWQFSNDHDVRTLEYKTSRESFWNE